ncbi:hypothetical protein STCU_11257 [Strigomonas culicis]|uniref:Uncharacterized protein n=1 Tax=Strigomonas culicis TaxID=28005 RepID=S9UP29_9TRYP|nr:hypothetical protein STCU_11257 [Strigomonas culicis]|eukprot:EPY16446.1 hypothetical protein STCU_11257 [Strigomonas culicis]
MLQFFMKVVVEEKWGGEGWWWWSYAMFPAPFTILPSFLCRYSFFLFFHHLFFILIATSPVGHHFLFFFSFFEALARSSLYMYGRALLLLWVCMRMGV